MNQIIERRKFLSTACTLCAGAVLSGLIISSLSSCAPLQVIKTTSNNKEINVPVSSFKQGENKLIVRNQNLEFDILLIKLSEEKYKALYLQCTHHPNSLTVNKNNLVCASHGSTFNFDGNVTGEPATTNLKQFSTFINQQIITIQL